MASDSDVATSPPEVSFRAAFEGPAVEDGRINARAFAPSLSGITSLVETSAEIFFTTGGDVTLQVRANFRKGSFEFGLVALAAVANQLWQNLSISDLKLMLTSIGLVGRNPKSLLRLILEHGDSPVEGIEPLRNGLVNVHIHGDNNSVTVNGVDERVAKLLISQQVREAVPEAVSPLDRPGITHYRLGPAKQPVLRISKEDLPRLRAPEQMQSRLADSVSETAVELLSPDFVDGNKWRVAQGGHPFWVRLLDEEFLASVDRGDRSFAKGDYLIVQLRVRAFGSPEGLKVERDIVRVMDHKHRGRQLGFA